MANIAIASGKPAVTINGTKNIEMGVAAVVPLATTGVFQSKTDESVKIYWLNTNAFSGYFHWYKNNVLTGTYAVSANTNYDKTFYGLIGSTTYAFKTAFSVTMGGTKYTSSTINITTDNPTAPIGAVSTKTSDSVTMNWTNTNNYAGYFWYYKNGVQQSGISVASGQMLSIQSNGLATETSNDFKATFSLTSGSTRYHSDTVTVSTDGIGPATFALTVDYTGGVFNFSAYNLSAEVLTSYGTSGILRLQLMRTQRNFTTQKNKTGTEGKVRPSKPSYIGATDGRFVTSAHIASVEINPASLIDINLTTWFTNMLKYGSANYTSRMKSSTIWHHVEENGYWFQEYSFCLMSGREYFYFTDVPTFRIEMWNEGSPTFGISLTGSTIELT